MDTDNDNLIIKRPKYDCKMLYSHWTDRYNKLDPGKKNAYWFIKLTAACMSKWADANVFESGQSALDAITTALNEMREVKEEKRYVYSTKLYLPKPDVEPTLDLIRTLKSNKDEQTKMRYWLSCSKFYNGWNNIPKNDEEIEFPMMKIIGNKEGILCHKYVSLRHLAEAIIQKALTVRMFRIIPGMLDGIRELKTDYQKVKSLLFNVGKLAIEATMYKDILYTKPKKRGHDDQTFHYSYNFKGSNLSAAMRTKFSKLTDFQNHYKYCTELFNRLKHATGQEREKQMIDLIRNKDSLKNMVSSQAQKEIIDFLFTSHCRLELDVYLIESLKYVKPKRDINYSIPVACLNVDSESTLPDTFIDQIKFYHKTVGLIVTCFDKFIPTMCLLEMTSESPNRINDLFGTTIPDRDFWFRPLLGYSHSGTVFTMNTPIETTYICPPLKESPSFVVEEPETEDVYCPCMGGLNEKPGFDRLDLSNTFLMKKHLFLEIEVNKFLEEKGIVPLMWKRTNDSWEPEGNESERRYMIFEEGKARFEQLSKDTLLLTQFQKSQKKSNPFLLPRVGQ